MPDLLRVGVLGLLLLATDPWRPATRDYLWRFPRDHWAHPEYKTEWWYFTGHLAPAGDSAPRFGYQFTVFRVGALPQRPDLASDWASQMLFMGHAAVTDLATGRHLFSEVLYRATPLLAGFGAPGDPVIAWSRAGAGTDDRWTLGWQDGGFVFRMRDDRVGLAMNLATRPRRPLVFQGPNGFSAKGTGPTAASLYYSFTRLDTRGTLRVPGFEGAVTGTSWMDKEFGSNQLARHQVGWDWFSLQLDDGRDLMLFHVRDSTGATDHASGTLVDQEGRPRFLARADFTIRPTASWTSDSTGATYPSRWTIDVPSAGIALDVEPLAADQENDSRLLRGLFYWEGAVRVRASRGGRPAGRGYVELVGYGKGLRPAI
jgi:predicted secreted hydrolase